MKAWAMTKTSLSDEAGDTFEMKAWAMTKISAGDAIVSR